MDKQKIEAPSLRAIFIVFLAVGMQSFGGGLSGWIRREVVQRREWMADQAFLSGLALCQIVPGPNAINLSIFVGTTLRGRLGAVAAFTGMVGLPMVFVIVMAIAFAIFQDVAAIEWVMAGVGAAAIGFNFATGIRMMRRGIRGFEGTAIMLAATVTVGWFGLNFLLTLMVLVPLSIGLVAWRRR